MIGRFLARRRARRDYEAFERVLKHACLSRQFRDTPASRIGALEALKLWRDDRIEAPYIFETIGAAPSRPPAYRQFLSDDPAPASPLDRFEQTVEVVELPEQIDLLEAAMGVTSARVP